MWILLKFLLMILLTYAPNQSNSFAAANRIPLMAKTIVLAYSMISLSENSEASYCNDSILFLFSVCLKLQRYNTL